jgi:predicted LPLAT superfamily acyltransferase
VTSAPTPPSTRPRWHARSYGGRLGHWFFHALARGLGPRAAELFLYPVVLFYLLALGKERRASMQYLERVLGPTHLLGRWARTYLHLLAFARSYLDGALLNALGSTIFEFEHVGTEQVLAAAKGGGVMVTAHLGAWELSSGMLRERHGLTNVAIVMFRSDEAELQRYIESLHGNRPRLIAVGEGELAALDILRAVRAGEVVCMQGDRTVDAREVKVPFFGKEARWPVGPWIVAALSGAPILWAFAVRVGPRRYRFIADPPRYVRFDPSRPRDQQLAQWVREYVERLEAMLRADPYQWFNFFDFWA